MSFTEILQDLENLQTAMRTPEKKPDPEPDADPDAGDEKIVDAAPDDAVAREEEDRAKEAKEAKDGEKDGEEKEDEGEEEEEEEEGKKEGEPFGKSFQVTLEDGEEIEAYDATLVLKSFDERISETEKLVATVAKLSEDIQSLRAALAEDTLKKAISTQTDLIKSLADQVSTLRKEGTGRKSVLNVHEKPTAPGTAAPITPNGDDLLTKAEVAMRQGRISALDVSRIETYLGRGLKVPPELLQRL